MKPSTREQWRALAASLSKFELQHDQLRNSFAFTFVEGKQSCLFGVCVCACVVFVCACASGHIQ